MVDLIEALSPEQDEVAVFSALLDRAPDGDAVLRHGALLIAPARCGEIAWGNWQREQGGADLGFCPEDAPACFLYEAEDWLAGRTVVSVDDAASWLRDVTAAAQEPLAPGEVDRLTPGLGEMPAFRAAPKLPSAVNRIFGQTDVPAANFVASAVRPARGFIWRSGRSDERPDLLLPSQWELEGKSVIVPTLCVLGLNVPTDGVPQAASPPFGLLVARLERRAWLGETRGDGKFDRLHVGLRWEPERVDLADLALELEQQIDGEVVSRARFPLEDLADIDQARSLGACSVPLPTIGRGVAFEVSLTTRDHELLDRMGPYPLVEQVSFTISADGSPGQTFSVGDAQDVPLLPDRLGRMQQVDQELADLLQQGAESRILDDRLAAESRLKVELDTARGELLVHDRFFGQDVREWELLRDVKVPVRVLTGKIADEVADIPLHVQARFRPKAPMHERVYLWDGGGLSLGGSPTTFGNAPVSITRLAAPSVEAWRKRFTEMWESDLFHDMPRASDTPEADTSEPST
jgi:hypothetical protein